MTVAAASALAGAVFAGCAKSSSAETSSGGTTGQITGSGSTGLNPGAEAGTLAAADTVHGQAVFAERCAVCHGAKGEGGMGPSLKNEKSRKSDAAAIAWIKEPKPPMPKLYPSPLGEKDVADVAAYVESL